MLDIICFHLRTVHFSLLGSGWRDSEEGGSSSFHKGNIHNPHVHKIQKLRLCQQRIKEWYLYGGNPSECLQDIYRPMLQRLAIEGISADEKSTFL